MKGICKEVKYTLIYWLVKDKYDQMNCFEWDANDNYWVVSKGRFNEIYQNWRGSVNNGQFHDQNIKEKRNIKYKCNEMWVIS